MVAVTAKESSWKRKRHWKSPEKHDLQIPNCLLQLQENWETFILHPKMPNKKKKKIHNFFTTSEVAHHMQLHFYMISFVSHTTHNLWLSPQELKKSCWICCVSRFIVLHWVVSKYMNETNTSFGQHFERTFITFAANSCSNKSRKVLGENKNVDSHMLLIQSI